MLRRLKLYLIFILSVMLLTTTFAKDSNSTDEDPNQNTRKTARNRKIVKGSKAWAIACSAVLNERNHGFHDSLSTKDLSEINIKQIKDFLDDTWGIKGKADLYDDLKWLEESGDRMKFEVWGRLLQNLSSQEYTDLLKKYENDSEVTQEIVIAKKYYEQLEEKSLIGWDCSRYIILCRWSYTAGYIDEAEAWERIISTARVLQKAFDSWEDLGKNYIIGRQFWSHKATLEHGYLYEEAHQRLLDMRSSPWNKYPWDMDLTGTAIVSIPDKKGSQT
jgi:hypothetical protein